MDYQYLTVEDQAQIVAEVQAAYPDPVEVMRDAERRHFRSVIESKVRGEIPPDAYEPPDVTREEDAKGVLDVEAGKFPLVVGAVNIRG